MKRKDKKKFLKFLKKLSTAKVTVEKISEETYYDITDEAILSFKKNTFNPFSSFDGRLFSNSLKEFNHVLENEKNAYSLVITDGQFALMKGIHKLTAQGYFIKEQ